MKKNRLFRLLTFALTLVFLCQFAVPAFAATVEWENNGDEFIGEVSLTGRTTVIGAPETSPSFTHTYGTDSYFQLHTVHINYLADFGMDIYKGALQPAYMEEQLNDRYEGSISLRPTSAPYYIPANSASGTYKISAALWCDEGFFEVYKIDFDYPVIMASGVFDAPYGSTGNVHHYRLVSG